MGTDKVTFVEQQGGVTGSDRVRMRNWYILYYYHSSSTVVPLHMTDRATGSNVTPKGFPRVRACTTEVGVSRPFSETTLFEVREKSTRKCIVL